MILVQLLYTIFFRDLDFSSIIHPRCFLAFRTLLNVQMILLIVIIYYEGFKIIFSCTCSLNPSFESVETVQYLVVDLFQLWTRVLRKGKLRLDAIAARYHETKAGTCALLQVFLFQILYYLKPEILESPEYLKFFEYLENRSIKVFGYLKRLNISENKIVIYICA